MGLVTAGPAANIINLYDRHASTWDAQRSAHLVEHAWIDRFTALLPTGSTVLDIGCGTGQPIARHLTEQGYDVTGIDGAPAMIALARERVPKGSWQVADMRTLDLGRRFDGLVAWDSFFHLSRDDQRGMFRIFELHAQPRAALMFTSGPYDGEVVGSFASEPLYHASLAPDDYRACLSAIGFEVVAHVAEDPQCGGHTVWLARRI